MQPCNHVTIKQFNHLTIKSYKHIFFDLDNTIWDFDTNSRETLEELYEKYGLGQLGVTSFDEFIEKYKSINAAFWRDCRLGKIDIATLRVGRFEQSLSAFNVNVDGLAEKLSGEYLQNCPRKANLFPHVHETLRYLQDTYILHVITNGFEEVQYTKLEQSDLRDYFTTCVTSEEAGAQKPDGKIFDYALSKADANTGESIFLGDSIETDMLGAIDYGLDQIYFNRHKKEHEHSFTYEIAELKELRDIF